MKRTFSFTHHLCGTAILLLFQVASAEAFVATDLLGRSLASFPFFDYQEALLEGSTAKLAIDPRFLSTSQNCDVYIVNAKSAAEWTSSATLTDVRGSTQSKTFGLGNIQGNTLTLTGITGLSAGSGTYSRGYDVVLDCDKNGLLGGPDFIDGAGDETGFHIIPDGTLSGPHSVSSSSYAVSGIPSGPAYEAAILYYPTDIQSMDPRPLVVMSHGNGYTYTQYSHLAQHLASWGYIVVSHSTASDLGPDNAADTTLEHTLALIALQSIIAGGAVDDRIDASRIVFNGHSTGGEGSVIAYMKLANGAFSNGYFDSADIALISAMAPTNHQSGFVANAFPGPTTPYDAPFHLWLGTADNDVSNRWPFEETQSPQIFGRAEGARSSTSIFGAGHTAFNDVTAWSGQAENCECLLTDAEEVEIVDAYLLAVVEYYAEADLGAREVLWNQWEVLKPGSVPVRSDRCGEVYNTFRGERTTDVVVLDDYQSETSTSVASSGASIATNVIGLREAPLRDATVMSYLVANAWYSWSDAAAPFTQCYCSTAVGACSSDGDCNGMGGYGAKLDGACVLSGGSQTCSPNSRISCDTVGGDVCIGVSLGTCNHSCNSATPGDPMNGSTYAGYGDTEAGAVFEWPNDGATRYYRWLLPSGIQDLSTYDYLTVRLAQGTNHPSTVIDGTDLTFTIELKDTAGDYKNISLSAYGAGVGDPFDRTTGSTIDGFSNEFETIRVRLEDFKNNQTTSPDLSSVSEIRIRVGSAVGSGSGRLIIDDVEFAAN